MQKIRTARIQTNRLEVRDTNKMTVVPKRLGNTKSGDIQRFSRNTETAATATTDKISGRFNSSHGYGNPFEIFPYNRFSRRIEMRRATSYLFYLARTCFSYSGSFCIEDVAICSQWTNPQTSRLPFTTDYSARTGINSSGA